MSDHSQPLHVRLRDEFMRRIESGEWVEGQQVPSEAELIAEFEASRGTIRQALASLRSDGVLVGGRGVSPRVHRTVPAQSFETFMSFTEWAWQSGRVPGQRTIELSRRRATPEQARELGLEIDAAVVEVVRVRLLDASPAMIERSTFPLTIGRHLFEVDLDEVSIYRTLHDVGIEPTHARHVIDAVGADAIDAEFLEVDRDTPLLRERRAVSTAEGALIEVADDRYLPALATFTIENSAGRSVGLSRSLSSAKTAGRSAAPEDRTK